MNAPRNSFSSAVPKLIVDVMRGQLEAQGDDRVLRERLFILLVGAVAVPILFAFAFDVLTTPSEPDWLALLHLGTAIPLILGCVAALRNWGRVWLALSARLSLFALSSLMLGAFVLIRGDFSILWIGVLPPLAIFVFTLREGLAWCAAILLIWLGVMERPDLFADISGLAGWPNRDELVDFTLAFACITAVSSGFELLRLHAREKLRLQTESLLQTSRLESIGRLTSGVAHDFNNLLTVIIGNLDLIALDAERRDLDLRGLQQARAASNRAAELTAKLLSFARKQPLTPEPIDIDGLLVEVRQLLAISIGDAIAIATGVADAPLVCIADRSQLENCLINLALNARDAMPDGGQITITAQRHEEADPAAGTTLVPGDYVRLAVWDTGTGIPADVRERVFEPFFTTKELGAGTGLGLSMVQGFARQSGGDVRIRDRDGQGTIIELYLPLGSADQVLPTS